MNQILIVVAVLALVPYAHAESRVSCDTLPAAVLYQEKIEARDATIRGCVKDKENGKLTYEVETLKDGKSRDVTVDATGTVLDVEQEVAPTTLPAVVSDANRQSRKRREGRQN
jgi:peptidase YpeB-like protein